MRKGYKVTLGVLTIMILLTLTIGTSYSYYSVGDVQSDTNELATACFKVTYNGTDGAIGTSNINLTNSYPMSEDSANNLIPYTLTITNSCTSGPNIKYDVSLNTKSASNATLAPSLRYKLGSDTSGMLESLPDKLSTLNSTYKSNEGILKSYSLKSGELAPGSSETITLRLWIDEAAGNEVMTQTFTGQIYAYAYL